MNNNQKVRLSLYRKEKRLFDKFHCVIVEEATPNSEAPTQAENTADAPAVSTDQSAPANDTPTQ